MVSPSTGCCGRAPTRHGGGMFLATAALCMCSLIHAFLLISVFPYAGYMVMELIPNVTPERAGPYAGFLSSSFMAGRTLSSYPWGRLADVYGRKFVLVASLGLSALFSVLFGMSQSFLTAMIWRFLLGISNGIVGTVKTVVSELTTATAQQQHDDSRSNTGDNSGSTWETRMMGLVVGMRAWGFLISPAVGGWLAEPVKQYPTLFYADASGEDEEIISMPYWSAWLSKYPFILPNLAGAIICVGAALIVVFCIQETLPQQELRGLNQIPQDLVKYVQWTLATVGTWCQGKKGSKIDPERNPLFETRQHQSTTLYSETRKMGSDDESHSPRTKTTNTKTTMAGLWENQSTRSHLVPYWFFSLVVVCFDEAFPLFCISTKGGLRLSEADIGKILSMAGLVFAVCQYAVYVATVDQFGLYPSLSIGCSLGFVPVLFIPFSLVLNRRTEDNDAPSSLTWPSFLVLMIIMAVSKIFSCMFFTSMSIALNKTVASSQRASLNGLATIGGSIAKGIGPIVAGFLVTASFSSVLVPAEIGSVIIFACIGFMGLATLKPLLGLKSP